MKRRFLIHSLNHTSLVVDITEIGLPTEIYPPEGKLQPVPSLRFQNWHSVEEHLLGLGANRKSLDCVVETLKRTSVAVLTIP
jgi:hypothetical protein